MRLYPRLGNPTPQLSGGKKRMRNRSLGPRIPSQARKLVMRTGSPSSACRTSCLTPCAEGTELMLSGTSDTSALGD